MINNNIKQSSLIMKRKIILNTNANFSSLSKLTLKDLKINISHPSKPINNNTSLKTLNKKIHVDNNHSSFISSNNSQPLQTINKKINFSSNKISLKNSSFLTNINSKTNLPVKLYQSNVTSPIKDKQCKLINNFHTPSNNQSECKTKLIRHFRSTSSNLTSNTDRITNQDTSQSELTIDNNNHLFTSPNINKQNSSFINYYSHSPSFRALNNSLSPITSSFYPISLDDMYNLYTSLNKIVSHLNTAILPSLNDLIQYWNLFYSSSFLENIKTIFKDTHNKSQIVLFTHLDSLCILLSIDISLKNEILSNVLSSLKSIFGLMHFNLLLIIKYILTQFKHEQISKIKRELLKAIENGLSENISTKDMKEHYVIKLLQYNVNQIALYYKDIINQCYLVQQCSLINNNNSKVSRIYNQNTVVSFSISLHEDMNYNSINTSNEMQDYTQGIISKFFIDGFNYLGKFLYSQYNLVLFEYILKHINIDSITTTNNHIDNNDNSSEIVNNIYNNINNGNNTQHYNINTTTPRFNNERNYIAHRRTQSENNVLTPPNNNNNNNNGNNILISSRISFNSENPNIYNYDLSPNNINKQLNLSHLQGKAFLSPLYYLPSINNTSKYSLILDLDDILIHVKKTYNKLHPKSLNLKVIYRPYLFSFLSRMKKIYEIILFTVNLPEYSNKILKLIESKEKYFTFKLYRQHITFLKNKDYFKDISKLGRDLKRTIIIDTMPQNILLHKENGIIIKPFNGENSYDLTLNKLSGILERIRYDNEDTDDEIDIRESLKKYNDKIKELLD